MTRYLKISLAVLLTLSITECSVVRSIETGDPNDPSESVDEQGEEDTSSRLPRFFDERSKLRRLRIDGQTGFDGKVYRVSVNEGLDTPGIRAYGLPRKHVEDTGFIERTPLSELTSNAKLVYETSRKELDDDEEIERAFSSAREVANDPESSNGASRARRSLRETSDEELEDLEAQDAKVFRPLFVYRQQVAARKRLGCFLVTFRRSQPLRCHRRFSSSELSPMKLLFSPSRFLRSCKLSKTPTERLGLRTLASSSNSPFN